MSRRFGRNQRRKMREQIAEVGLREEMVRAQWRATAADNERLRPRLRNAIEVGASLQRNHSDPSVFFARVDLTKQSVEPVVVQMRVSEMSIRDALSDRSTAASLTRRIAEAMAEQIIYAR